jgi:hypothetical protein
VPGRARVASQHRRELAGCKGARPGCTLPARGVLTSTALTESTGGLARASESPGGRGVAVTVLRVPAAAPGRGQGHGASLA